MEELVRKVTPMMVLPDILPVQRQYEALGFELVTTDHPGCVALCAGKTALILVSVELMQKDFKQGTVAPLVAKLENVTRWVLARDSASSEAQPRHPSPGRAPAPDRSVVLPFIGSPTPTVVESPSAT